MINTCTCTKTIYFFHTSNFEDVSNNIYRDQRGRRHLRLNFDITTTYDAVGYNHCIIPAIPATEVPNDHINDTYDHRIPVSLISIRPSIGICDNRHGLASKQVKFIMLKTGNHGYRPRSHTTNPKSPALSV